MKVKLEIAGYLRSVGFGKSEQSLATVQLQPEETLDELLRRFSMGPEVDKIVLVNGRHCGPRQILKEGDHVFVMPEIAGG